MSKQYPVMLYLGSLNTFAIANDDNEYDKLIEGGYTTHDKVKDAPVEKQMDAVDEIDLLNGVIGELKEELADKNDRIDSLEAEIKGAAATLELKDGEIKRLVDENAELKSKLAVYESAADANDDGVVSYDEMNKLQLQAMLDQRGVDYTTRDSKADLIKLANDSE